MVGFIPLNNRPAEFFDLKLAWNFRKYAAIWANEPEINA